MLKAAAGGGNVPEVQELCPAYSWLFPVRTRISREGPSRALGDEVIAVDSSARPVGRPEDERLCLMPVVPVADGEGS